MRSEFRCRFKGLSLFLTLLLAPLLAPSSVAGGEPVLQDASVSPAIQMLSATAAVQTLSAASASPATPAIPKIATQPSLTPFKAYYQAQFDLGVSVSGEAFRELKALPDGQWQLSMTASTLMAKIEESSRFEIRHQQLRPLEYRYKRKVFMNKKQRRQLFDWSKGTLASTYKDQTRLLQISQPTYDNISYQLQLWRDLKAGLTEMSYSLADGDHLKTLQFDRAGEEFIDTPAGRFETIRVKRDRGEDSARTTRIWFAKDLENVIVKLEQIETDGKEYVLLLEHLETP
ncbi:MAG: hypothetical protein ACJAWL_002900 [Motiliproteus sp.]|jgi:hypothetical protein